jgi:hypothetical protein
MPGADLTEIARGGMVRKIRSENCGGKMGADMLAMRDFAERTQFVRRDGRCAPRSSFRRRILRNEANRAALQFALLRRWGHKLVRCVLIVSLLLPLGGCFVVAAPFLYAGIAAGSVGVAPVAACGIEDATAKKDEPPPC